MSDVQIKITHQHNDELDYHEWVYVRMEAVDRLGRPNPRMGYRDWPDTTPPMGTAHPSPRECSRTLSPPNHSRTPSSEPSLRS